MTTKVLKINMNFLSLTTLALFALLLRPVTSFCDACDANLAFGITLFTGSNFKGDSLKTQSCPGANACVKLTPTPYCFIHSLDGPPGCAVTSSVTNYTPIFGTAKSVTAYYLDHTYLNRHSGLWL